MLENSAEKPLQVRTISEAIGEYIARLGPVWIEGELSEVKVRPGSSMVYMRLRDTSADMSLSIMCHKSTFSAAGELSENHLPKKGSFQVPVNKRSPFCQKLLVSSAVEIVMLRKMLWRMQSGVGHQSPLQFAK